VPINGEPGTGYWLEAGFDFPPLMFTEEELEALVIGMRLTQQCTDKHLREAATTLLAKVEQGLPRRLVETLNSSALDVPYPLLLKDVDNIITLLRRAVARKQWVEFTYADEKGQPSERRVRPLELSFWGKVWTLTAWCELRGDFRNFRLDRIGQLSLTGQYFMEEADKNLEAYYRLLQAQGHCKS
jgi:predicted DNA-binding transcriptional regulator YafY